MFCNKNMPWMLRLINTAGILLPQIINSSDYQCRENTADRIKVLMLAAIFVWVSCLLPSILFSVFCRRLTTSFIVEIMLYLITVCNMIHLAEFHEYLQPFIPTFLHIVLSHVFFCGFEELRNKPDIVRFAFPIRAMFLLCSITVVVLCSALFDKVPINSIALLTLLCAGELLGHLSSFVASIVKHIGDYFELFVHSF